MNKQATGGDPFASVPVSAEANVPADPNNVDSRTEPILVRLVAIAIGLQGRVFCYLIENPPKMTEGNLSAWADWSNSLVAALV